MILGFYSTLNNSLVGMWAAPKELSRGLWISRRLIQARAGNLEIFHRAAIPSLPQDREIKGLTKNRIPLFCCRGKKQKERRNPMAEIVIDFNLKLIYQKME
ncbi:MAG: hypothetical protein J7K33_00985 [Candidatus Marinimicrobia bacterium]|nr:hypothetical protein [Candidatus Neomarinimicrobiota bacterium]